MENIDSGAGAAGSLSCVLTAEPAAAPFLPDPALERSDIRADLVTGAVQDGVPLRLKLTVQHTEGSTRAPLTGAWVEVWHCDPSGTYGDWSGGNFLHGVQVTDANGVAEFRTIFPGWYTTRAVHVHFRIRFDGGSSQPCELASELFFDDAVTAAVHARSPYSAMGQPDTPNGTDCVFTALSPGEQAALTLRAAETADGGYEAEATLGVRVP